jgi:hypothetical protein
MGKRIQADGRKSKTNPEENPRKSGTKSKPREGDPTPTRRIIS